MNIHTCFLQCLDSPSSIPDLLKIASNSIQSTNEKFDYYSSLDHYFNLELLLNEECNCYLQAPDSTSDIPRNPNYSHLNDFSQALRSTISYIPETRSSVLYWRGSRLDIFFHPILVGYSCQGTPLSKLGWGSSIFGAQLASFASLTFKKPVIYTGRTVVILTRHLSKYAHFVRDRFTKFIWSREIFSLSSMDTLVCDFPLSQSEIDCFRTAGFQGKFIYMSEHLYLSIEGDIVCFEVCTGVPLLPSLRTWLLEEYLPSLLTPPPICTRVFLSRGINSRRNLSNHINLSSYLESLNFHIVDNARLPILEQLYSCFGSDVVIGVHGAQLINAILTKSTLVEIMPYPYCLSAWSHTMIKMCDQLSLTHIPYLASQSSNLESLDLMGQSQFNNFPRFNGLPESYQSQALDISLASFSEFLRLTFNLVLPD